MNRFSYTRAEAVQDALERHRSDKAAAFIAGGTNLVDLLRQKPVHAQLRARRLEIRRLQAPRQLDALGVDRAVRKRSHPGSYRQSPAGA